MPLGLLDEIEGHFQNYLRLDDADAAVRELLQGVRTEPLGQLGQLDVGQAGVGLADVEQLRVVLRTPAPEASSST